MKFRKRWAVRMDWATKSMMPTWRQNCSAWRMSWKEKSWDWMLQRISSLARCLCSLIVRCYLAPRRNQQRPRQLPPMNMDCPFKPWVRSRTDCQWDSNCSPSHKMSYPFECSFVDL
jgi:hypothetical protein